MPVLCGRACIGRMVKRGLARYLVIHVVMEFILETKFSIFAVILETKFSISIFVPSPSHVGTEKYRVSL
jgi:hypothetical protein